MQVLDATDNGPSGPDDFALAEIAHATERCTSVFFNLLFERTLLVLSTLPFL